MLGTPQGYRFNPAFEAPGGSAIRELFKYLSRPGMISFAGGYPAPALFDAEGLAAASAEAMSEPLASLQYGATEGTPALREQLAALMARRGASVAAEEIVVMTGSQQGLDLLIRVLLSPGDAVLVERPTYPAALQALRLAGCKLDCVPSDAEGLDIHALARQLDAAPPGHFRLLYCVPDFANPTGACLSLARRLALLALAARHQLLLVEDDPYGALRFNGDPLPSLLALAGQVDGAEGRVVHLSSLSKVVAPGLRIGWMVAPAAIRQRCVIAKQTVDLCTSPISQQIASCYLAGGALERHLPRLRQGYGEKCQRMLDGIAALGGRLQVQAPTGGMFVWGRLADGSDAQRLFEHAIEHNVMFVPGRAFYASGADPASLRLSFAAPSLEQIDEGLRRLARALG
ncbi:PLP-dependent aminotransferase family protein [Pseudomonas sp. RIT-PI-S]|uniref:aminotransferase-like domain-containing protein n=1 Tax=Pseudomonas sp. RIT-PI-S TaxID=3035295 RepID=UPI0021DA4008|nr:PLP-dependent aminotransferase family protein [Pseudomonas sp. RIT-PI-S]